MCSPKEGIEPCLTLIIEITILLALLSSIRKLEQSEERSFFFFFSRTLGKNEQWKKEIESFGEFIAEEYLSLK